MPATIINNHFNNCVHTALSVKHDATDKLTVYRPASLLEVYAVENYCIAHNLRYHMYVSSAPTKDAVPTQYGYKVDMPSAKVQTIVVTS